jgi:hypothetical protein
MQSTKSSTGDFWLKMGRNFCVASLAAVMVAGSFGLAQAKDAVRAKIENYGSNALLSHKF